MPAKSKSQQRLFGMVHAYNKGEFHGPRGLRARLARLSDHISDEDARHFAQTPHKGLPEKTAQAYLRPDQADELAALLASHAQTFGAMTRSARRRSFLRRVIPGIAVGAAIGGLGAGGLAAYLTGRAARNSSLPPGEAADKVREAALQAGLWGAGHGAVVGGATGVGLGVLDKIRGQ